MGPNWKRHFHFKFLIRVILLCSFIGVELFHTYTHFEVTNGFKKKVWSVISPLEIVVISHLQWIDGHVYKNVFVAAAVHWQYCWDRHYLLRFLVLRLSSGCSANCKSGHELRENCLNLHLLTVGGTKKRQRMKNLKIYNICFRTFMRGVMKYKRKVLLKFN